MSLSVQVDKDGEDEGSSEFKREIEQLQEELEESEERANEAVERAEEAEAELQELEKKFAVRIVSFCATRSHGGRT